MIQPSITSHVLAALYLSLLVALAGCSGGTQLMPTPNIYANGDRDPFPDVPTVLQNNRVDVIYLTDRASEGTKAKPGSYGYRRSRSVAFGLSEVEFGQGVSWAELNKASRTAKRSVDLKVTVAKSTEIARFPQTPRVLVKNPNVMPAPGAQGLMLGDDGDTEQLSAETALRNEISAQLSKSPVKEVYLFVHGYNNNFTDSVTTIAQLWHFLGRQGVPISYSWPAGSSGLLRGYTYDRESSEFTVYHLKQMLRAVASCPDVKKINIISHSRGTDVTVNAVRELHMEIYGSGRNTREVLKLGTLVLAAPDIDLDVMIQKFVTVRLGAVPECFAMYVCQNDKALGISTWLFGSLRRAGQLQADVFKPEELEYLRASKTIQIVDSKVSDAGAFGHDYFHSNPAVSSDLILLIRYGLAPGAENGRPLGVSKNGFWSIDDKYPHYEKPLPARRESK